MVHNYRIYYNKVNEATQEWLEHLSSFPIARAYQAFIKDAGYMLKVSFRVKMIGVKSGC